MWRRISFSLSAVRIVGIGYFSSDIYGVDFYRSRTITYRGRMGNWNVQIPSNKPIVLQSCLDFLKDEDFRSSKKRKKKRKIRRKVLCHTAKTVGQVLRKHLRIVRTLPFRRLDSYWEFHRINRRFLATTSLSTIRNAKDVWQPDISITWKGLYEKRGFQSYVSDRQFHIWHQ